jgi:ribosome-associated toxin RatA of RatAB toxin-antitoxin module
MPKVVRKITINAPIERVFDVIADFESYPDFLPEMEDVKIKKKGKTSVVAAFRINMVMSVNCVIEFKLARPARISWSLVEGEMMKRNDGEWRLKKLAMEKTEVTYSVNIELGMFVPRMVSDRLIEKNLPATLAGFKKRAEGC